jgi:hypothetical protein
MWTEEETPLWHSLRKGGTNIHVRWREHAYSNNLYADDTRLCTDDGVALSLDLNRALKNRNGSHRYDAEQLLENIEHLTLVQLSDEHIIDGLAHHFSIMKRDGVSVPETWTLLVQMNGDHRFRVRWEGKGSSFLLLHVDAAL